MEQVDRELIGRVPLALVEVPLNEVLTVMTLLSCFFSVDADDWRFFVDLLLRGAGIFFVILAGNLID